CASSNFPCIFFYYSRDLKPNIVGLLKTRVSRGKNDLIIAKLGFEFSHRLEAVGFSGGIWIGWNELICVEILQ
ncbi:hypothetical protein Golax_023304, partial [Gossypium laxum]|nr:hypothetical protein [Gossypium laxum]